MKNEFITLCYLRAAARLCTCHRTTRMPVRYPFASSWWDELLSVRIAFLGVHPRPSAHATTLGPKRSIMGPQIGWLVKVRKLPPHPLPQEAAQLRIPIEGETRIICFLDKEPDFMLERIEELGWGFMYNAFPPINITMVREFFGNFSADHQTQVFLRGRWIPFSEEDIHRFLGINIDLPPLGEDDTFKAIVANRKRGELDMDL
ncbi:hypothetical protein PIB30_099847, partial [Stylosanthes scabra]|nr:hypothetical protein [Stylosanthes scabra]